MNDIGNERLKARIAKRGGEIIRAPLNPLSCDDGVFLGLSLTRIKKKTIMCAQNLKKGERLCGKG
jgi:hypothetical protein